MTLVASADQPTRSGLLVPVLFTVTIFTSALLLFFVQPLFTRLVLPQIGGATSVWTTAMLFFQTVLIGGYVYAHVLARHVPVRWQIAIHLGLLLAALLFLPLAVPEGWAFDPDRAVVSQTLWLYALGVGLPFAVLSANAPLIQSWYRLSGGPHANDPYFLYSASNLGSLVALLAFPLVAEPLLGLTSISLGWSVGFVALGGLLLASGLMARGRLELAASDTRDVAPPRVGTLAFWAFLAFVPSSLMLGVTSKISMDAGSFPLVWVLPLSLYLLTFVLVFSTRSVLTAPRLALAIPVVVALLVFLNFRATNTMAGFGALLAAFFIVSLYAHRRLFEARPDARHLTVFYITMSVGGALGGIFNSIVAPLVFSRLDELTITIALSAALMIGAVPANVPRQIALGLAAVVAVFAPMVANSWFGLFAGVDGRMAVTALILLMVLGVFYRRPFAGTVTVAAFLAIWGQLSQENTVYQTRSFFGPHQIKDHDGMRLYSNGSTVHGAQWLSDFEGRPRPLFYYHSGGPMAEILLSDTGRAARTVGIVGLGIGSMACYARPGQSWHFYEIDKTVADIALNPDLFSFMSECGRDAQVHLGDARIVLQRQIDLAYDVLVIDAYSSDAVPVHLATLEALELYRERLSENGLLVFHISNRFYDLSRPHAAAIAALGLEARIKVHSPGAAEIADGDTPSVVVAMARTRAALGKIADDPSWQALPAADRAPWTDDHADLLSALR
ncbi:spermidine synthase [Tabrizicola sp. BL-A-41-H6]|uniref:spermidine synthase n=1 Tax=Tabrizicola sp. BL-A-41-H6 TaxID=3421107 RepID=UPI003D674345